MQASAVDALSRIGVEADGKILLDTAAIADSINQDRMLRAAFTLGGPSAIEAAIETADSTTIRIITPFLTELTTNTLKSLLMHPIAMMRIASFDQLNCRLKPLELEEIFNEYVAEKKYFYNIVVAFDEALYGPKSASRSPETIASISMRLMRNPV